MSLNKSLHEALNTHKKHVVATMVIDKERGLILLGRRKSDGIWTSPAGHMQGDESPRQGAIREAFEEANLQFKMRDLKDLPSVPLKKGRVCHVFLVYVDSHKLNIHVTNDPDKEVGKWEWFGLNDELPKNIDAPRLISINNAKMRAMGLKKAILENPDAGIDLNTAEQSQDAMAAGDNEWIERILEVTRDAEYGSEPVELMLPKHLKLYLSKVDDGIYSGIVKKEDEMAGDNGEVQTQLMKMTPESMVQALKAKGYLPRKQAEPVENPKLKEFSELFEALKDHEGDLHIHLHKSLYEELVKDLV